jgi:flagellar biosynthetic protein FlhB
MPDQPAAERTEQPTPRRLEKAREEGRVPQSQELVAAATLLTLLLGLAVLGPGLFRWCRLKVSSGLAGGAITAFSDSQECLSLIHRNLMDLILATLPILTLLFLAGVAASVAVSGLTFAPAALRLRWDALNPANSIQNLISKRTVVHLLASLLKLFFVTLIAWLYLSDKLPVLARLRWAWEVEIVSTTAGIILGLGLRVGVAILVIGLADALYQKWQYLQELKMTRQEVKQERKDMEGAPEIKGRIRRIQVEMSLKRLKQKVPKATVILVNPTHVAVALQYDPKTMEAPVLLAKGADLMAERIVKIGRSYGIPVVQRPAIARAIYATVKPGQPIPEALYMAVAEVLALIYRLRQKKRALR